MNISTISCCNAVLCGLSVRNPISGKDQIELEELKHTPCILISSKEQEKEEEDYYKNTLGIGSSFLFAESLEEGRLMVAGNRGFLPVEEAGSLPPEGPAVRRVPITRNGRRMQRNYCVFWKKIKQITIWKNLRRYCVNCFWIKRFNRGWKSDK